MNDVVINDVAKIFILVGVLFDFVGGFGLIRLPDIYNRLQAATKCVTLGTCLILTGVIINYGVSAIGFKALFCIFFLLLTSPTAAHAISRGSHIFGIRLWEGSVVDKLSEDKAKK